MSIGENIKAIREHRKLTQVKLAKRCGISQGQLSEYERDIVCPSIKILSKIADVLEVSVAVLDESLMNPAPDPFLQIVHDNWQYLTDQQKGTIAGEVSDMASPKKKPQNSDGDSVKLA